jgi:hypothetical protein
LNLDLCLVGVGVDQLHAAILDHAPLAGGITSPGPKITTHNGVAANRMSRWRFGVIIGHVEFGIHESEENSAVMRMVVGCNIRHTFAGRTVDRVEVCSTGGGKADVLRPHGHVFQDQPPVWGMKLHPARDGDKGIGRSGRCLSICGPPASKRYQDAGRQND